jgi:hypothetical protein
MVNHVVQEKMKGILKDERREWEKSPHTVAKRMNQAMQEKDDGAILLLYSIGGADCHLEYELEKEDWKELIKIANMRVVVDICVGVVIKRFERENECEGEWMNILNRFDNKGRFQKTMEGKNSFDGRGRN